MAILPGISVRPCTSRHVLGLCLLNAAVFPPKDKDTEQRLPAWRLPGEIASTYRAVRDRLDLNHVLVATTERGKVVGSVEVHTTKYLIAQAPMLTQEQAAQLQPYLSSLAVSKKLRGNGIGRALVQAAVAAAQENPQPDEHLLLQVESNNTAAVKLYEACGFQTISHPWCQISLMRRQLQQQPDREQPEAQAHDSEAKEPPPPASPPRAAWLG